MRYVVQAFVVLFSYGCILLKINNMLYFFNKIFMNNYIITLIYVRMNTDIIYFSQFNKFIFFLYYSEKYKT